MTREQLNQANILIQKIAINDEKITTLVKIIESNQMTLSISAIESSTSKHEVSVDKETLGKDICIRLIEELKEMNIRYEDELVTV